MSCFRERRTGQRKRKSVRGCVVGPDLATLSLVIVRKGPEEIAGLTDDERPQRLGTSLMRQRKRRVRAVVRQRMEQGKVEKAKYMKRIAEYRQEQKEIRAAEVAKKKKARQEQIAKNQAKK